MPVLDGPLLIDNRVRAIQAMHKQVGNPRAQLDVSGGIDSAVLLGLLVRAQGKGNVTAVYSSIHSGDEFRERAQLCADAFGVRLMVIDLSGIFDDLTEIMTASLAKAGYDMKEIEARTRTDRTVLGSLRSCLRAPVGRGYNRMTGGGIRHGTGNECEDRFLRFYQKGGDGEVDTNPIAMLGKGEVFQLARALGVPAAVIDALPSPDLHAVGEEHNDEDELLELTGVAWTYSRIDPEGGEYKRVGSIERMSRFLDSGHEAALFGAAEPTAANFAAMANAAASFFPDSSESKIGGLLRSCRRSERTTRHKANPNIPSLGTRQELLDAGLLTDELPELGR
jgi:NAD+ synthase